MTEAEWLHGTNPQVLLNYLRLRGSERKLRLFACACCRRVWHLLPHPYNRQVVEVAEAFAAGTADARLLDAASRASASVYIHDHVGVHK